MNLTRLFLPLLFSGFLFLSGCDSTTAPPSPTDEIPQISSFSISPDSVSFSFIDGFKDTTITVTIQADIQNATAGTTTTGYVIRDKSTELVIDAESFEGESVDLSLNTTTTSFETYLIEVFSYDNYGRGGYAQSTFVVEGFSNNKPEILVASNPSEVTKPDNGSITVPFTAKVTDQDGQNTIEGVYLRLISQVSGEVSASPFRLFDNGSNGDTAANDSVYTVTFQVSDANSSETYDIQYYAIDLGGFVSDTVNTTFTISD